VKLAGNRDRGLRTVVWFRCTCVGLGLDAFGRLCSSSTASMRIKITLQPNSTNHVSTFESYVQHKDDIAIKCMVYLVEVQVDDPNRGQSAYIVV